MKFSQKSIKSLSQFRSLGNTVIIDQQSQFYVFGGKPKKAEKHIVLQHTSAVAIGILDQKFSKMGVYDLPKPSDTSVIANKDVKFDPVSKISFFKDINNGAKQIASFYLDEEIKNSYKDKDYKTATHLRIWKKDENLFIRAFDARRYYDQLIESDRKVFPLIELWDFDGSDFIVYIVLDTFKKFVNDSYDVSVLDNDIIIFHSIDAGVTYHIRNQRLGNDWIQEIKKPSIKDNSLLLDPRRGKSLRRTNRQSA